MRTSGGILALFAFCFPLTAGRRNASTYCTEFFTSSADRRQELVLSLWQAARRVAHMPPMLHTASRRPLMSLFYGTVPAVNVVEAGACGNTKPYAYIEVWKAANNNLKQNLDKLRCNTHRYEAHTRIASALRRNGTFMFTFVDDWIVLSVSRLFMIDDDDG